MEDTKLLSSTRHLHALLRDNGKRCKPVRGNPKSLSLGQLGLCEMFRKDFLFFHLRGQTNDSYKKGRMGAQPSSGWAGGHTLPLRKTPTHFD